MIFISVWCRRVWHRCCDHVHILTIYSVKPYSLSVIMHYHLSEADNMYLQLTAVPFHHIAPCYYAVTQASVTTAVTHDKHLPTRLPPPLPRANAARSQQSYHFRAHTSTSSTLEMRVIFGYLLRSQSLPPLVYAIWLMPLELSGVGFTIANAVSNPLVTTAKGANP